MAYSHSNSAYAGTSGSAWRANAATDIVSQEEDNNRSLVRFYGYMTKVGTSGVYNLNATYCNIQPSGELVNGNVNGYDGRSGSGPWYGITYDKWIYHNNDGTGSFTAYFYHNAGNGTLLGEAATSHNAALPTLYRYVAPTYVTALNQSYDRVDWRTTTNRLADGIGISVNGGAYTYWYRDFTDTTVTLTGLAQNTTHSIKMKLRRKVSGLWRDCPETWYATTIYGYADPQAMTATNITDIGFTLNITANYECSSIKVSIDNGGTWTEYVGDFTTKSIAIGGSSAPLRSDIPYFVKISLKRKLSGYWKEASFGNVTTVNQNKFFDMTDF